MKSIQQLQETIHYQFRNPAFLEVALTHSSYANEVKHQIKYNERQEFLGDAVLSIIVSDYLFNNYTVPEGELTKLWRPSSVKSRWTSWQTRSVWGSTCVWATGRN